MHEEIVGIIREVCGKDIDEDMSLFGDLQMDSVEMIELVLRIEEKYLFDFESYDELMNHMDTVKDFVCYMEEYITKNKKSLALYLKLLQPCFYTYQNPTLFSSPYSL